MGRRRAPPPAFAAGLYVPLVCPRSAWQGSARSGPQLTGGQRVTASQAPQVVVPWSLQAVVGSTVWQKSQLQRRAADAGRVVAATIRERPTNRTSLDSLMWSPSRLSA